MSTMIVVLFVFSTLPFMSNSDRTVELRDAIHMVQLLQQPDDSIRKPFKAIFKDTIISLQTAAGIYTFHTQQSKSDDPEKATITISIKSPYLLPEDGCIQKQLVERDSLPIHIKSLFQSLSSPPDVPPPALSANHHW